MSMGEIYQRWAVDGHRGALPIQHFFTSLYRVSSYRGVPDVRISCPPLVPPSTGVVGGDVQVTAKCPEIAFHGRVVGVVAQSTNVETGEHRGGGCRVYSAAAADHLR